MGGHLIARINLAKELGRLWRSRPVVFRAHNKRALNRTGATHDSTGTRAGRSLAPARRDSQAKFPEDAISDSPQQRQGHPETRGGIMRIRLYVVVDVKPANPNRFEKQAVADEIWSNLESVGTMEPIRVHILPEEEE